MGLTRTRDKSYWESKNLILAAGEVGFEYDTGKSKLGNGHTRWKNLPYTSYPAFSVPEVVPAPGPTAAETVAESHDTDTERESFTPVRLSDAALRTVFGSADPVLSNFSYDSATGNLLSYQEDGITITLTYNADGTVATSKRGAAATKTYSYSGGNLVSVA